REILIITTPGDLRLFEALLGDGSQWGISIEYATQSEPRGLAEAFIIGADFVGERDTVLILGDNIFFGHDFVTALQAADTRPEGATVFGYWVRDPQRYGVLEFDQDQRPLRIIEKPRQPPSHYAVTGLYFYDNAVIDIAREVRPSARDELEITDVNNAYLDRGTLHVERLGRGVAWLDTGTEQSLLQAASFIHTIEQRQGLRIACLEEIALRMGLIDTEQVLRLAGEQSNSAYGDYLRQVCGFE
ncbi:MAG: glucose-1-phosphate thymidylyltransferase, partial [Gammaproteobacteria bacterium]|nr:glucose-1-phosphate thymidylyltransferase [Gammaproteobacteria bacterium]